LIYKIFVTLIQNYTKINKYLKRKYETPSDIAGKVDMSSMLYRALDELKDKDLIITEEGSKLTDAGKIARLREDEKRKRRHPI